MKKREEAAFRKEWAAIQAAGREVIRLRGGKDIRFTASIYRSYAEEKAAKQNKIK